MQLAWKTFLEFEAPVYKPEGIRSFYDFIKDDQLRRMFLMGAYQMFVAFADGKMIGMITMRGQGHISLLFVDEQFHRQGIGRVLIETLAGYLKNEMGMDRMTVNSSPYGVGFYHKLGFQDMGSETETDGIKYTPMELLLS
ncbi:MAG: GNAT family N-acetyltransferase [Lachnospiraceae bacterium]|nr:GNAT family N-acetyltransferase [Lachnospiraceae bacterium]